MSNTLPRPLRSTLKIRRLVQCGEICYIVKEVNKGEYYRFSEAQYEMISLFDGKHDMDQLVNLFNEKSDKYEYEMEALADLIESCQELQLLQRNQRDENIALLERLREERKKKMFQMQGSLLFLRFHIVDPNQLFDRIIGKIQWLWNPRFLKFSLVFMGIACCLVLVEKDRFLNDLESLYIYSHQDITHFLAIWLVVLVIIGVHECGHGLTCKHYGGEVHDMGLLFLVFQPCLYCNVNDAWLFPDKKQKLFVALAGIWVELMLASLAVFIWLLIDINNPVGRTAFIAMSVGTASSLLFNMNPLMKFDGYYVLSDYLETPNLRQNALAWLSWKLKTGVFRIDLEPPFVPTSKEQRIYVTYGVLSVFYLTIILTGIAVLAYNETAATMGFWGILGFFYVLFVLMKKMLRTWPATLQTWASTMMWGSLRKRMVTIGMLVCSGFALVYLSPAVTIVSRGTVATDIITIHAPEEGFVIAVGFDNDRRITDKYDVDLITFRSPDLELVANHLEAQTQTLSIERNRALVSNRASLRRIAIKERTVFAQLNELNLRLASLKIPIPDGDWEVNGLPPASLQGRFFHHGEAIITLNPARKRKMHVVLKQGDLRLIRPGLSARIRLHAKGSPIYQGVVKQVAPAAKSDGLNHHFVMDVDMHLPQTAWVPPLGMTGEVIVIGDALPLWQHLLRPLRQILRTEVWL